MTIPKRKIPGGHKYATIFLCTPVILWMSRKVKKLVHNFLNKNFILSQFQLSYRFYHTIQVKAQCRKTAYIMFIFKLAFVLLDTLLTKLLVYD